VIFSFSELQTVLYSTVLYPQAYWPFRRGRRTSPPMAPTTQFASHFSLMTTFLGLPRPTVLGGVRLQLASQRMLSRDCGAEYVLPAAANLVARTVFLPPPATKWAEESLTREILPSLESKYEASSRSGPAAFAVAIDDDGRVVGLSGIVHGNLPVDTPGLGKKEDGPLPRIAYVSVEPHLRRKGIGAALVRMCEDVARCWGEPRIALYVEQEGARALYTSLGYAVAGEDVAVDLPSAGKACDEGCVIMVRRKITPMVKLVQPRGVSHTLARVLRAFARAMRLGHVWLVVVSSLHSRFITQRH